MDPALRLRTSVICGALALAIAGSVLLRGRSQRPQLLFAAFAADIGLWYLAQWLYLFVRADVWVRFTAILAVMLPQFALHLFDSIVPVPGRGSVLLRVAGVLLVPMLVLVLSPQHQHGLVRGAVFLYVFGLFTAGLVALLRRAARSGSRETYRRVRALVVIGGIAVAFSLADFLWFIGAPLPPVGAVVSIVFLFLLSESLSRARLVDLYDLVAQLTVSTALAFCLAGIFYAFVVGGGFRAMYLNAVLAAIVILVLFEPLKDKVEAFARRLLYRERIEIERAVGEARTQLLHVLEVDAMIAVVIGALEGSRRATGAAVYLRDPAGPDLVLAGGFGPAAPARLAEPRLRGLLERVASGSVVLEALARSVDQPRPLGQTADTALDRRVVADGEALGPFRGSVCVAIRGEGPDLMGILLVSDDRVRDAYSDDEVKLLESLAQQMGVVVENARVHRRLQSQDRLAALGQMAAGLAHEVKNPLGAIKGAAQLLSELEDGEPLDQNAREFVSIIIEEANRLDRVVGSVLDYARPSRGDPGPVDVNAVVRRTLQLLAPEAADRCVLRTELAPELPAVRADAEQLRQVLINLVRNSMQALAGREGAITVQTTERRRPRGGSSDTAREIAIAVTDDGPGIQADVLGSLFVPFFTTKASGTGLGLAISQRVVGEMGGRINVDSRPGAGATFTVVLPVADAPAGAPQPV